MHFIDARFPLGIAALFGFEASEQNCRCEFGEAEGFKSPFS